ncbi:acyltransferase family protein [Epidermidibacterium keratini]|uniref:Acyltransferase family protein n=1 Tax=Epidermidibacterium keratini TaxID=1891644 RepID=A0A7L4YK03_9ACTN|nr:acyltransferase [Epidermidibacterium keratini]QHB99411.1 acyltransferase family protein [Epidermidibacterium keratini]
MSAPTDTDETEQDAAVATDDAAVATDDAATAEISDKQAPPEKDTSEGSGITGLPTGRSAGMHYPALDGARAIGAFMVLMTHVGFRSGASLDGTMFGGVLARFNFGVTLFFVLSGFLLYRPFAAYGLGLGSKPKVRPYFRRRASRIIPALWAFVVIVLLFVVPNQTTFKDFYSYLLLIQVYNNNDARPELTHLWSLSSEVLFYLLLPVLAWLFARQSPDRNTAARRQLIGIAAVAGAGYLFSLARGAGWIDHFQAALWLPNFISWFCLGMFLAVLSLIGKEVTVIARLRSVLEQWAQSLATCWFVAIGLFLLSSLPIGTPYDLSIATSGQFITQNILFGLSAFFFVLPLVLATHRRTNKVLGTGVGRYLGDISYSIYLWHVPALIWAESMLGLELFSGNFWLLTALTTALSIAVASASWLLLERPAMRYLSGRRRRQAKPKKAQQASAA